MALADQEARQAWRGHPEQGEVVEALDRAHAERLRVIVEDHGWPDRSVVGSAGAQAAWLLVLHADHDPPFQRRCLDLIQEAADRGEADPRHVAFLTDRVLIHGGKPQRFGTQLRLREDEGRLAPILIDDPDGVDERRREVGLDPMEDSIREAERAYGLLPTDAD